MNTLPDRWRYVQLRNLANVVRGSSPRPAGDSRYFNGDFLPWITVADVTSSSRMYLDTTQSALTSEGAQYTRILEDGTLILTNSGATLGVPKIIRMRAGANDGIAAFLSIHEDASKEFLYFFLQSKTKYFRERLAPGVGQPNLNTDLIGDVDVPLPTKVEQEKIVELLSCWDNAIELAQKLFAAKLERKRGLMQQLLTGKRRFQDFARQEWKRLTISDFTIPVIRVHTKPDKAFLALGIRSHGKGTFLKPDFDPAKIEMTELYEVKENDLIVNITFAWEGAVAIAGANDTGALVSHRFPTFEFNTEVAIPEYFRHVIVQKWFVERLGLISPGGAGRNRVLSKRDFGKLEVLMPSVEEQRRIAEVLNACDKEIDLLKQQLDAFKRQKRGLMQKLLTGQIRVKVDEFEAAAVKTS